MELMDQPDLDPNLHVAALNGLRRINSISRSAAILWPSIAEAAREFQPNPLRVLDLACGAGDNVLGNCPTCPPNWFSRRSVRLRH